MVNFPCFVAAFRCYTIWVQLILGITLAFSVQAFLQQLQVIASQSSSAPIPGFSSAYSTNFPRAVWNKICHPRNDFPLLPRHIDLDLTLLSCIVLRHMGPDHIRFSQSLLPRSFSDCVCTLTAQMSIIVFLFHNLLPSSLPKLPSDSWEGCSWNRKKE